MRFSVLSVLSELDIGMLMPADNRQIRGVCVARLRTIAESMRLNPQDLAKIADVTLEHYNRHAEDFWRGTRGHDVSQNIAALLQAIEGDPPFTILDFGCGPGRDLKAFAERGHGARP
jgi:hypothetical protein